MLNSILRCDTGFCYIFLYSINMKHFLPTAAILLLLASCGAADKSAATDSNDSSTPATTTEQTETIDSPTSDTVEIAESADTADPTQLFLDKLPAPRKVIINNMKKRGKYLSKLGFKGKEKFVPLVPDDNTNPYNNDYYKGKYTLKGDNGEVCTIEWEEENYDLIYNTVTGNKEALQRYYNLWKKERMKSLTWEAKVSLKGNTIKYDSFFP